MIGIKEKFCSLSLLDNISSVNVANGTSSTVHEKCVIHATSSLSVNEFLFVLKFPVSLIFISKLTTQIYCFVIFYSLYCVFQDL